MSVAKSVIVLAACNVNASDAHKAASDTMTIKTVLAIVATRSGESTLNILAEIFHPRNRVIAGDISPEEITTIDTNEVLAKIIVQTSRSVGQSVVYSEILSFDGCEMSFHQADWGEIKFGKLCYHFPDRIPMGILRADNTLLINPSIDTDLQSGDSILILVDDDSTIKYHPEPVAQARMIGIAQKREEVCLGVKIKAWEYDPNRNFGVKLIPDKNTVYTLSREDTLVVLAEDQT